MTTDDLHDLPDEQHLSPDVVLLEMARAGAKRALTLTAPKVFVLSMLAGAFIAVGALFSILIASDVESESMRRLLEGFGFSVGFFLVILSGALLFTEVNVELPATLLRRGGQGRWGSILRLWVLAAIGNLAGAFIVGILIEYVGGLDPETDALLGEVVVAKMRYRDIGGVDGYLRAIVSGALGNWLVGMAAFLSVMGRTIIGKYIPVFLVVSAFVASGFLHSPANMAYISLIQPTGAGPGWGEALTWSIVPAAIGNILGAFFLVALPFWYAGTQRD
jgi:formate transporter